MATKPEWQWVSGPENKGILDLDHLCRTGSPQSPRSRSKRQNRRPHRPARTDRRRILFLYADLIGPKPAHQLGYPRTWQGFMHAIGRKQYEQVKLAQVLDDPAHFIHLCELFFLDLPVNIFRWY